VFGRNAQVISGVESGAALQVSTGACQNHRSYPTDEIRSDGWQSNGFVTRLIALAWLLVGLAASLVAPEVRAGAVLEGIRARGVLRCGVSEGIPGFSQQDASGRWRGMDADFCRAVAAAALGDPEKVRFVPLKSSTRFPALKTGRVDLLLRNTTWTLSREVLLDVQFPGVLVFDGQGFLVPQASSIRTVRQLEGATVCVEKGTTHVQRLTDHAAAQGFAVQLLVVDSAQGVAEAFFAGRCAAYTSDASQLAAVRAHAPGGAEQFTILPDRISREPLGPVVASTDIQWITLVRWVIHALVGAEEHGMTSANVDAVLAGSNSAAWRLVSGQDSRIAAVLGVPPDWAVRAVRAVGNYGEMFERNLGSGSALGIERGPNRLWSDGGLLYSPPID